MGKRVAITGLGVVSPLGNDLATFEQALREGRSGLRRWPDLEELRFRCCAGGRPEPVDDVLEQLLTEEELQDMDVMNRYGSAAAYGAWKDADLEFTDEVDLGTGVIIGSESPALGVVLEKLALVDRGRVKKMGARYTEQTMMSGISSRVARLLGLGNRATAMNATSATGTVAVLDGYRQVQFGLAERMLCGGVQSSAALSWASLDAQRVTNRNWDPPEKASRPMSQKACGLVPSSGAGIILLESLEGAVRRGAKIYAEVLGGHVNCGACRDGGTLTAPSAVGARQCAVQSVEDAGVDFADVDLINGHLTGTMADVLEIGNWARLFESVGVPLPYIHSTKSLMGHPLTAAGSLEVAACCLMLRGGFIHPSLNCEDLIPEMEPYADSVPHVTVEKDLNIIVKSSLGFGDVNAAIVLERWR